jgi:hypothetical protein
MLVSRLGVLPTRLNENTRIESIVALKPLCIELKINKKKVRTGDMTIKLITENRIIKRHLRIPSITLIIGNDLDQNP